MHKFLFYNKFIICLYTFRALLNSSSGGQNCIIQHLVSSHSVGVHPVHTCTHMNFLVHSYTSCSDRHASPYWAFIFDEFRYISPLHYIKKLMTDRCSCLVHVASGASIFTLLLRRRVAFLNRTATCRPLFKSSVSLLKLTIKSSCVSNFYRTFKVFIWLSPVHVWKMLYAACTEAASDDELVCSKHLEERLAETNKGNEVCILLVILTYHIQRTNVIRKI